MVEKKSLHKTTSTRNANKIMTTTVYIYVNLRSIKQMKLIRVVLQAKKSILFFSFFVLVKAGIEH